VTVFVGSIQQLYNATEILRDRQKSKRDKAILDAVVETLGRLVERTDVTSE
jgi:HD-GYP domain-containing protein (c-di-GMP phosphodiesterase class II)